MRKLKWPLIILAAICALVLIGDFVYSRMILHRHDAWERTVERYPDGVRTGCREFTVGSGDTALLMIHGFADSPAVYRKMAPMLAEMGFTCRVMRRPGLAMPIEEYAQATREKWRAALVEEVATLRENHDEVWIVAHSLGGAITFDYLLDDQTQVDGAILLAPLIKVSSERSPLIPVRFWYRISRPLLIFTKVVENPFEVDAKSPEASAYDTYNHFIPRSIYDEIYDITGNIAGRAGELTLPMLMVLSRDDRIVDSEAAHAYYVASSSARKELLWMEDAGHMIPIDNGWDEVAAAIAEFVVATEGVTE
jgi:carboxylesterase